MCEYGFVIPHMHPSFLSLRMAQALYLLYALDASELIELQKRGVRRTVQTSMPCCHMAYLSSTDKIATRSPGTTQKGDYAHVIQMMQ